MLFYSVILQAKRALRRGAICFESPKMCFVSEKEVEDFSHVLS